MDMSWGRSLYQRFVAAGLVGVGTKGTSICGLVVRLAHGSTRRILLKCGMRPCAKSS